MGHDRAVLGRCLAFEIERQARIAERVERYGWGRAFLSPTIPLVWDANWILVERSGLRIAEIIEAADESIGAAGMEHRTVVILNDADGERLVPEFESRNWDSECGVYMLWQRKPDRHAGVEVLECRHDEIVSLRRGLIQAGFSATGLDGETTVEQLVEWDRRVGRSDGDRWFVAPATGKPAAACRLLARDGVGQVEDVATLPEARGQGLARAVTLAAARASEADGNELTFLGTLAEDWPRLLYAKLGFDVVGRLFGFRRRPRPAKDVRDELAVSG